MTAQSTRTNNLLQPTITTIESGRFVIRIVLLPGAPSLWEGIEYSLVEKRQEAGEGRLEEPREGGSRWCRIARLSHLSVLLVLAYSLYCLAFR
jgi:hypothetical protein